MYSICSVQYLPFCMNKTFEFAPPPPQIRLSAWQRFPLFPEEATFPPAWHACLDNV